ncbi:MAG: flavodoxin [Lachnospiraceae bacterium]|nr:flavodoxin [Lachnospiraceae bacterium]
MSKVAVVYWSGTGNTETMANAVVEGAKEAGAEAELIQCGSFNAGAVANYDAIAFGCPAMGAEELEESEFAPMYSDVEGSLSGKKIALFGSYGWGDGEWMRSWAESAKNAGANLATDCVMANNDPDDDAIAQCKALGKALA